MRKSLRRWIGTHKSKTSSFGAFAKIEEMEKRVLLSGSPLAPSWYGESVTPEGTQMALNADGPNQGTYLKDQLAALAPNGDVITVYPVSRTDGNTGIDSSNPEDIVIAAFKSNGTGGLTLDTSFGDYSNDPDSDVVASPGYSIVSVPAVPGLVYPTAGPDTPLAIVVDPAGNITVGWLERSPGLYGILQLTASGSATAAYELPGTTGPTFYEPCNLAVDPVANGDGSYEVLWAGIDAGYGDEGYYSQPVVWAFRNGTLDTSYGDGSGAFFSPDNDGVFSGIAADSQGVYLAEQYNDSSVLTLFELSHSGSQIFNSSVSIPSSPIAPSGDVWLSSSPDCLGLTNTGDVVLEGITDSVNGPDGYALIQLTASGSPTTWGPNSNGQLWIAGALPTSMVVNGNGDILLNDSPDDTSTTATGTWIGGSTGAQEPLFYPYIGSGTQYPPSIYAPAPVFDAAGDAVLAGIYESTNTGFQTLATYSNLPDAPLLQSAASIFDQGGTPYSFNLNLDVAPGQSPSLYNLNSVSVDGRMTSQNSTENLETMQLTFAPGTELSGGTVSVANFLGGTDGTVYSTSISGNVLDIQLYNVNNMQTLVVTVNDLENTNTGVSGSYQVYEGVLWGDTDSNGEVNSTDFGNFAAEFGKSDTSSNFMDDFGCEGEINSIDFGILAADFGKSLPSDQLP